MSTDRVAVDANILVYAVYRDTPQHAASRAWLERAVRGEVKICLTSQVLAEFFAIVTNPKRVSDPRTPDDAVTAIEAALALPGTTLLPVLPQVTSRWLEMLRHHPVRGGAVFDLQLIATLAANGVDRICTFNRADFERFPGLEIVTP
jgi:toxin-antitoxin system PIN domain toxin